MLLIETSCAYGRELLLGIAKYSRIHGPWMFYKGPPHSADPSEKKRVVSRLMKWANGAIIREPKSDKLLTVGVPIIVSPNVIRQMPNLPVIVTDCVAVGRIAAEHLLDRGFRQFAYCGFDDMPWSQGREENFCKRITEAGFETHVYERSLSEIERFFDKEQISLADWLKSLPKPVGLMTCNDDRSQQVVDACIIAGLHVPEEVAIVGVDNDELVCALSNPSLSSIPLNAKRAGYEAAELLDKLMAGEKMAGQRIIDRPTHVVARQSTDILATEDRDVAQAMRFIRQHAKDVIGVTDVVYAVALSRRVLEKRFRRILGRSVLDEIRRVRVAQVARMLVETNLPISRIALALGYPSVKHIARSFRKEKGMTPLAYRKQYGPK